MWGHALNLFKKNKLRLVDLSYWSQRAYPGTYKDITALSQSDEQYLNSVKGNICFINASL